MMMDSPLGHPGEVLLVIVVAAMLMVGGWLFILSSGTIMRAMYRINHPDDPQPPRWGVGA